MNQGSDNPPGLRETETFPQFVLDKLYLKNQQAHRNQLIRNRNST